MKIHPVRFKNFYTSPEEWTETFPNYREIENNTDRIDDCTAKYVDLIQCINKPNLTILDIGGGQGGHYLTLKKYTTKQMSYSIVELPQAFTNINDEVKYYLSLESALNEINNTIDVIYSNGTIFLTKGITSVEHLNNFCKSGSNYIFLSRMILSEDGNYDHFFTLTDKSYNGDGTYFSIIQEKYLKEICMSYEYELIDSAHLNRKFVVSNAPPDIGLICYKDLLFKKINIKDSDVSCSRVPWCNSVW